MMGIILVTLLTLIFSFTAWAESGDRQVVSGPFSFSVRGGAENDSAAMGFDGRLDYLNPLLNVHLFTTFDLLDGGRGQGKINNNRYGTGIAFSHTIANTANLYAGTSFIRELDKYFGHAYLGGKVRLTDYALLSASYGFGFDNKKVVQDSVASYTVAEAVDWFKVGGVLVDKYGWKANLYYYLSDTSHQQISGIEGELSYPVLDYLTVGVNGGSDLSDRSNQDRSWRSFAFMTYAFGGQKANPIAVALDKNNPIEYPRVVRTVISKSAPTVTSLVISQSITTTVVCQENVTFTVSGGVAPYSWSTDEGSIIANASTSSANLTSSGGYTEGIANITTVTVRDAAGRTATATVNTAGNSHC
jgi:hypothetical protein